MAVVSPEVLFRLKAEFRGQAELDKAITSTQKLQKGFDNVGRAAQRQARVANDNTKATNRNRMAFNQIGFQINDFSTQMQNGAKFSTAFSQQIGQLGFAMSMLGGKVGLLGGILGGIGGTVLSLAVMFGQQLFGGVKDSEKATLDITKAMDLAALSASELTEVTKLLKEANEEYQEEAKKSLGQTLANTHATLESAKARLADAKAAMQQRMANRISIGTDPSAIASLSSADDAARRLSETIEDANANVEEAAERFRGLKADLMEYNVTTTQTQRALDTIKNSMDMVRAAVAEGTMSFEEGEAALRGFQRARETLEADSPTGIGRPTARGTGRELTALQRGLNGISEAVTNLQRRFESGAITEAQYTQGLANQLVLRDRLNEEHKTGIDILNEYASTAERAAKEERDLMAERFTALVEMNDMIKAKQIEALKSRGAEAREEAKNLEQSFVAIGTTISGIFRGLITGAQSFGDAIKSVIGTVIDELFRLFVVQQIVGFVSGALQGAIGGSGKVAGATKSGGLVGGGGAGGSIMGGKMGSGGIMSAGMISGKGGIGGGTAGMVINVDARGSTDPAAVKAQVQQGILEAAPSIIAAAQNKTINSLRRPKLAGAL